MVNSNRQIAEKHQFLNTTELLGTPDVSTQKPEIKHHDIGRM